MEGFTSHCKAVTITGGSSSVVTFTGANGELIQCNALVVTASDAGSNATAFLVVPSGVSQYPAISLGNGASGTFGYLVGNAPLSVILGHNRRCSAVTITNVSGGTRSILISYGITTTNPSVDRGYPPQI